MRNIFIGGYNDNYGNWFYIPEVLTLYLEKSSGNPRLYWQRLTNDIAEGYKYKVYRDAFAQGS